MRKDLTLLSDADLIVYFTQGDTNAFGILFERYRKNVEFITGTFLQDSILAQDIVQDIFIRAFEAVRKRKYKEVGNFKAWLTQLSRNVCIDHFRRVKRKGRVLHIIDIPNTDTFYHHSNDFFFLLSEPQQTAENQMINRELREHLRALIEDLPKDQRELVILRCFYGFKFKEISRLMNTKLNTCLGLMRYALINLRKMHKQLEIPEQKKVG